MERGKPIVERGLPISQQPIPPDKTGERRVNFGNVVKLEESIWGVQDRLLWEEGETPETFILLRDVHEIVLCKREAFLKVSDPWKQE